MRFLQVMGVSFDGAAEEVPVPEPEPLAEGVYWQSGLVTADPLTENGWIEGLPGLSSGASVTILRVVASAAKTGSSISATYKGDCTIILFRYWNGSAYAATSGYIEGPFSNNGAYGLGIATNIFDSQASTAWLVQLTESDTSGGFIQADAFTVA